MIAADRPVQRPRDARILVVDACGHITHAPRSQFVNFLHPDDLVIANDAATLPASLHGLHLPSGAAIEVRLAGQPPLALNRQRGSARPRQSGSEHGATGAGRSSLAAADVHTFSAVVFGAGDFHMRTEDRAQPPSLFHGDRLALGPLSATVEALLDHPRLVLLRFDGSPDAVWEGLARHGRPIQYAHMTTPLALWDVWTPIAGLPVAFEPPSASFALDWKSIHALRERGITLATITAAAGISSTGDPALDRRLPFDEPYRISETTASAIGDAKAKGGRSSPLAQRSCARSSTRPRAPVSSVRARGSPPGASGPPAGCVLSKPSFQALTSLTAATIRCSARFWTMPRWPMRARSSRGLAIGRTSLAIRC